MDKYLKKCAKCGKEFYIQCTTWGYKKNGKYYCSYSCYKLMVTKKKDGRKLNRFTRK